MTQEIKHVVVEWEGGMRFRGGAVGGPVTQVDGDNAASPGPMATLLVALAACTGSDLVHILDRMRLPMDGCRIELHGTRREEEPRRYVAIHLEFTLTGEGLEPDKVTRAVMLSLEKYCSVVHSLAPDIAVTHEVRLG